VGSLWVVVGSLWVVVDRSGSLWGRCGSLWGRCGSLWVVVGHCGSLWVVVGRCGSFHVLVTTIPGGVLGGGMVTPGIDSCIIHTYRSIHQVFQWTLHIE
jgi:hypothetical protein